MKQNKKFIVILGPTATGKTKLAVKLALKFKGEIVSADSRQVFRGMDIGTGKDLKEYVVASGASRGQSAKASKGSKKPAKVPYHLIDIISPNTSFNVAKYQKLAYRAIAEAQKAGNTPFLVGGTGLYIDAITKGFVFNKNDTKKLKEIRQKLDGKTLPQLLSLLKKIDPETYNKIDQKNRRRVQRALEIYYQTGKTKFESDRQSNPDLDILILGIAMPIEKIYKKIDSRLETRIQEGMIKEVKKLRKRGVSWKKLDEFGLEYRYVSRYLRGILDYNEMIEQLKNEIHHFAKRQVTWFKRNENIIWIKNYREALREIKNFSKAN
ncbi:MAG: tRNA (adenosine(37)-N6)-dimethylallyltransferase MiaA [Candidatus Buchananbacteria bacterium]